MNTKHKIIFGNCMEMGDLDECSIQLIVTSPPYYNAPFDYDGLFASYEQYLGVLRKFAIEAYRVLAEGRIFVLNIDDMLVNGLKYPIVADATKIFQDAGFRYRDRIIWKKPDGYLRISKRSGVILQNPFPMYYYPDNLLESIIIFQKGKFDYRSISKEIRELSKIDKNEFQNNNWHKTLWEMTNVLGKITSKSSAREIKEFNFACDFSKSNQEIIEKLFQEAKANNFEVIIEGV